VDGHGLALLGRGAGALGHNFLLVAHAAIGLFSLRAQCENPDLKPRGDLACSGSCASAESCSNHRCWRTWLADGRSRGSCASRDRSSWCAASLKRACFSSAKVSALHCTCVLSSPSLHTHSVLHQNSTMSSSPARQGAKLTSRGPSQRSQECQSV
jgi:hypothetical protein